MTLAVVAIGALSLVYLLVLPGLFRLLMPLPDAFKILLSIALIAPLAFAMGMPFPLGLARTAGRGASPRSLGLGRQRLRVGRRGDSGDDARHPLRIRRGRRRSPC